jgi:hypothetical protein
MDFRLPDFRRVSKTLLQRRMEGSRFTIYSSLGERKTPKVMNTANYRKDGWKGPVRLFLALGENQSKK